MLSNFIASIAHNAYCVYQLKDSTGTVIFIWHCKFVDVLRIKDAMSNPAFKSDQPHTLEILSYAQTMQDVQHLFSQQLRSYAATNAGNWPILNYTVQYNRLGNYICEQTGEVFYKQADIVRKYKCSPSALSNHIRGIPGYSQVMGYSFKRCDYMQDTRNSVHNERVATRGHLAKGNNAGKPIYCVETGQEWPSAAAACEALQINKGQMSMHLRGVAGYKHIRGMRYALKPTDQAIRYP